MKRKYFIIILACLLNIIYVFTQGAHRNAENLHTWAKTSFYSLIENDSIIFNYNNLMEAKTYVDSVNHKWQNHLNKSFKNIKTSIQIMPKQGHKQASKDSIASICLNRNKQIYLTGYIDYQWYDLVNQNFWYAISILIIASCIGLLLQWKTLGWMMSKKKEQIISSLSEEEMIKILSIEESPIYKLEDGLIFDVALRILMKNERMEKLTPQVSLLLENFLKSETRQLTQSQIYDLLWPDGSGNQERIYTVICRLRKSLKQLSTYQIRNSIDVYQLVNDKTTNENGLNWFIRLKETIKNIVHGNNLKMLVTAPVLMLFSSGIVIIIERVTMCTNLKK